MSDLDIIADAGRVQQFLDENAEVHVRLKCFNQSEATEIIALIRTADRHRVHATWLVFRPKPLGVPIE